MLDLDLIEQLTTIVANLIAIFSALSLGIYKIVKLFQRSKGKHFKRK